MDASTTVWLAATAVAAVFLTLTAVVTTFHRRTVRRERARVEALATVARRLETTLASLDDAPVAPAPAPAATPTIAPRHTPPLVALELPGRAALLDALVEGVERARVEGSRLSAAVVRLERDASHDLSMAIGALAGAPVYAVGPRSLALVLPDVGRAGALGVLARIAAEQGTGKGRAVELEIGEDATELAVRLLEPAPD